MNITVVSIDEKALFDGCKVRGRNGIIRTIKVMPEGKTISECVREGIFDLAENIDYDAVMLNKSRFTLVNEDDDED